MLAQAEWKYTQNEAARPWKQSRRNRSPSSWDRKTTVDGGPTFESMPGVMAYGPSRETAISGVRALALRVAADCTDHGEEVPPQFEKVFSVA